MIQYYYTKKEWGVVMEKEELKILEELRRILNSKNEAIVILNNYFKGGVGKSKLSTMFAYLTDKFNLKVLMIDKDLQATLTKDLAKTFKVELPRVNFYEGLKNGNLASSIVHLTDNLDLIPGTFDLMLLPKLTRSWTFENESRLLATLLAPLKSDYDLIIALGRQTLCITDGLLLLSDDMILGILAHEIGHLSYGHTVIQLLIGGGNIFISGCLLLIKISYWIFSAIMGLFAICSRSGVMGIITAVFAGISTALSWLWVKFCMLFLMWSMRQNEYLADEFAYKIGFGLELATVLDQHISDVPHDGFLSAIYSTHPCNDDRVAALQNLGVPYSRY